MGRATRVLSSEYQEWAKTRSQARFNLVASGVHPLPLAELGATLDDLELSGPSWYGYPPLQAALAAHCGVPEEQVVAAVGTSLAVHLAMAALVEPGDELLLEHPTYEPLLAVARYLGAEVKRFARRPEAGWGIDLDEIERLVSPHTKLIVLSDLHNPSGARLDDATLAGLGELARRAGARVLVDEVYLEMVRVDEGAPARTAARLGPEYVVASSLTKAYGLNGLRCGWVLAEPALARRIWRLTDLFHVIPAHPAERLSVVALARLDRIADRARALLAANRALLHRFLDGRDDLEAVRPRYGTLVFPRWRGGDTDRLCDHLRARHETTVVPGRFFGLPEHFRIGIGGPTPDLAAGLERLGAALDEL